MHHLDDAEIQALSALVGAPVVAFERAVWGFENRTDIVTLADGRRLVIQRLARRVQAPRSLRLAQILPDRLAQVGIRLPHQIAADAAATPPYAIREYLSGTTAAVFMGEVAGAVAVAAAMGALLPKLQSAPIAGLHLPSGWADASRLERQARRQLDRCREMFDETTFRELTATIGEVRECFAGRAACFAHGDFCPVNALVEAADDRQPTTDDRPMINDQQSTTKHFRTENQEPRTPNLESRTPNAELRTTDYEPIIQHPPLRVVGLLDVDYARVADPLFDAAWWGWVVRYHHPERWVVAWPELLRAAGIRADQTMLRRVGVLQRLRCLEAVDEGRRARSNAAEMWARRLTETLGWADRL
jgi:aminoglycoside phosphotransferase (APT) family kinase protein